MQKILLPFSWIYAGITSLRNLLYDKGWIRSFAFDVPVICVGNITVGGTGKTPCIEYLINLLSGFCSPGLISRGYRRKTKGLVMANSNSDALDIGDEPFQIKQRFPLLPIVVSGDRVAGINSLLENTSVNMVLMDDGFQHRAVRAGLYVMMIDYNRPLWDDYPFPAGFLRESASGRHRAHIVIVNKCPKSFSELDRQLFIKRLKLHREVHLFFSCIHYGTIKPLKHQNPLPVHIDTVVAVSGIANAEPFHQYLQTIGNKVVAMSFGDHYHFKNQDLLLIDNRFLSGAGHNTIAVTTEKDAARMGSLSLDGYSFAEHLYYLPIELEFLFNEKDKFDHLIKQYVEKN